MSKPKRIKISETQCLQVGNFKDGSGSGSGNGFVGIRKMYRKKGETSNNDWKPARQNITIPVDDVPATIKALRALADDIENAETWTPEKKED